MAKLGNRVQMWVDKDFEQLVRRTQRKLKEDFDLRKSPSTVTVTRRFAKQLDLKKTEKSLRFPMFR